jgi:hypothetical protein
MPNFRSRADLSRTWGQAEFLEQVRAGEASDRGDAIAGDGEDHDPVSVAARGLVGQVGGQRRVPVGAGADQADGVEAAARGYGSEEAGDLGAAGDRGELGWHGQDHVLAQQRGQGIDVAALPRVDEPVQDLPLVVIQPHAGGYGRRGTRSGQGRAGALHGAVDRRDADVQQGSCLGGVPGQHVGQDEGGPLPGGQSLQGGDECQRDALAPFGDRGRVGVVVGELV